MNKFALSALIPVLAVCFASCTKSSAPGGGAGSAEVLIVNGCTNLPEANVVINGVTALGNLPFQSTSKYYLTYPAGSLNVIVSVPGAQSSLKDTSLTAGAAYYSVFLAGSLAQPWLFYTADYLVPPPADSARIRFIDLSPDSTIYFNCLVGDLTVQPGLTTKGLSKNPAFVSNFMNISPSQATLTMQDSSGVHKAVLANPSLSAGHNYTAVLTGSATGAGNFVYSLMLITNI